MSHHVVQSAVVVDELQLLYVPIPKAGSTAILWGLAELVGLASEDFERSTKLEVTRSLTIHDMSIWGDAHWLVGRNERDIERILRSEHWLRFSVVRQPVQRIWSAWLSKILVRDPRFTSVYGHEDWFPPVPTSADDIIDSFRRFVAVLPLQADGWHDPHWLPQVDLLGIPGLGYDVVGRVEELASALAVVDGHLSTRGRGPLSLRRENASPLPFDPGLLDRDGLEICTRWTAGDHEAFGYEPVSLREGGPDDRWIAAADAVIPAIRAVIERNERLADVRSLVKRSRAL